MLLRRTASMFYNPEVIKRLLPDFITGMFEVFYIKYLSIYRSQCHFTFINSFGGYEILYTSWCFRWTLFDFYPVGDSVVAKRIYKGFPISFPNRVTLVYLITSYVGIYVIFEMYGQHACFTSIDCRTRLAMSRFPNELGVKWKGEPINPKGIIISCI